MYTTTNKSAKVATRGQKQIYEENKQVIKYYSATATISSSLYALLSYFLFPRTNWEWFGFVVCAILQLCAVLIMRWMSQCHRNEKGQVIDAGSDLNQPEAFGEYCKDVVILCSVVLVISMLWSPFFWMVLLIPTYVTYKIWTSILAPWFFAEPMQPEVDDRKLKKKERKLKKL